MSKINLENDQRERLFQEWSKIINSSTKQEDEFTQNELMERFGITKYAIQTLLKKLDEDGKVERRDIVYKGKHCLVYRLK